MAVVADLRLPRRRRSAKTGDVAAPSQLCAIPHTGPALPRVLPGLAAAAAIGVVATMVGRGLPMLGAPLTAILVGAALSVVLGHRAAMGPGIAFSSRTVLQTAVVVLGSQLSLRQVAHVGLSSLPVMVGTLVVCLVAAFVIGRLLGVDGELTTLIGVGTAICGASAIAAASPVIKARSATIAYAVSTIFFFNVAAVLVFPPLGHLLGLSQSQFGLFAGTAVNDTSSVVAAATMYGAAAGHHAVVVKLTRTLMIIPVCLVLGAIAARREAASTGEDGSARRLPRVPLFLVGFLVVAGANSAGLVPAAAQAGLEQVSVFLISVALAAIGLSTDFRGLRAAGLRPLLLGGILWVVVSVTSLALQLAF